MLLFDSHIHLSSQELFGSSVALIKRSAAVNVKRMVNICTDPPTLQSGIALAKNHIEVVNAGAVTPHDVEASGDSWFPLFEQAAREGVFVAIGETGLEYFYKDLDRKVQQKWLVRHLHLAAELQLPVIFHCREAFADLFAIVDEEYPKNAPALVHCFTGSVEEAQSIWDRGWLLSFSGIVTYKRSENLRQIAKIAPLNRFLIETDAPYLAPQSKRGHVNEPAFILETASCIAAVRGVPVEEVAEATYSNAMRFFHLS